jgi:ferrous iron transport protein B
MNQITIALVGNPNVGKSTLFNALTGADQHVGNWPGKTVEKHTGTLRYANGSRTPAGATPGKIFSPGAQNITIVDLPGTYSLSAYSLEEEIARDFVVEERPHLVIDVVDASNIERNLYLTAQILETGVPLIIVLNMQDQAAARGVKVDAARLSSLLGNTLVVSLVARRGQGIETLRALIFSSVANAARRRAP